MEHAITDTLELSSGKDRPDFITSFDLHLFQEGTHLKVYEKLGSHPLTVNNRTGVHFAVWAPGAQRVYVQGDFNGWDHGANPLSRHGESGVWSGFIAEAHPGAAYQYRIVSWHHGYEVEKSDPFSLRQEGPPRHASFVWDLHYEWGDGKWTNEQCGRNSLQAPICIYEVDIESWMRVPEEGNRWLTFREIAPKLAAYVKEAGFTHVQLLPVTEHTRHGTFESLPTNFFAPAAKLGTPQDLMFLVDSLHQHAIGVFLDWTPAEFPDDEHGLAYFDGTHLFERGSWSAKAERHTRLSFDFGRSEVRSFLLSNAFYWLEKYHFDGLKVDSVSSMLYLDYGKQAGEWVPNEHGGRENLPAIQFLKRLNTEVYRSFPGVQMIAEELTGWPLVSRPAHSGGLGFGFKWDPLFIANSLLYFSQDVHSRSVQHALIAGRDDRALQENLVLPLPHQVSKQTGRSILATLVGDQWQQMANLRLLLAFQYLMPGKKLLFMGTEFGQWRPWDPNGSLDWHLRTYPHHEGVRNWLKDLNLVYSQERALHASDTEPIGFEWVQRDDAANSVAAWLRRDPQRREVLLIACNFTPAVQRNYVWGSAALVDGAKYLTAMQRTTGEAARETLGRPTPYPSAQTECRTRSLSPYRH